MLDLVAAVVEVILAGDLVAGFFVKAADIIAHDRAAGVAQMEVARRVRRDEFDVDFSGFLRALAVILAFLEDLFDERGKRSVLQEEVDEARAGDLDLIKRAARRVRIAIQRGGDLRGDVTGLHAEALRELQRVIALVVAESRIRRGQHPHESEVLTREGLLEGRPHDFAQFHFSTSLSCSHLSVDIL